MRIIKTVFTPANFRNQISDIVAIDVDNLQTVVRTFSFHASEKEFHESVAKKLIVKTTPTMTMIGNGRIDQYTMVFIFE
jgi:hypothetical protein